MVRTWRAAEIADHGKQLWRRALLDHRRADGLVAAGDLTPFIFTAGGQQLCVEVIQVARLRQRHPVIAPKVAGFALNPALLVRFPGVQKSLSKRQCERKAMNRVVSSR